MSYEVADKWRDEDGYPRYDESYAPLSEAGGATCDALALSQCPERPASESDDKPAYSCTPSECADYCRWPECL